jgi:cytochrome c553
MNKTIAALTMCFLASCPAWADGLIDGSAESGKAKSVTCGACHGADGNSVNPLWPSIAGQHSTYLFETLWAFKGDPANGVQPTRSEALMLGQVMMLSEDDMRNLAVYFSELPSASKTVADPTAETVNRGRRLYLGGNSGNNTPACIACHGPTGRGNPANSTPSLQGQYAAYTAKQLRDYASGARKSDGPTRVMRDIASKLTEADILAVASYVQGLQ